MPENRVQDALWKIFPTATVQRIETWTGAGIFDSNWQFPGKDLWIEYKQGKIKKGHPDCGYKIDLRKEQRAWAAQRISNGCNNLYVAYLLGKELVLIKLDIKNLAMFKSHFKYEDLKGLNSAARKQLGI